MFIDQRTRDGEPNTRDKYLLRDSSSALRLCDAEGTPPDLAACRKDRRRCPNLTMVRWRALSLSLEFRSSQRSLGETLRSEFSDKVR